ncbi:thioredoxin O2, mitochondrial isoform X2 [Magnolia sinica]|uniref:thioredoxin O2, mitochondrial isoform X2 n=1 Tax=Magnolia sinica TaxID=86752 RepID=UPI002658BB58|nr:thioredoxin O2, mitochondrial isoform X2 [Magnolia sinica]
MGRTSLLRPSRLLPLLRHNNPLQTSSRNAPPLSSLIKTPISQTTPSFLSPLSASIFLLFSEASTLRTFSSSAGPSNIVLIESEEELNSSLNKVQGNSLPAVFYFTAVWCGPCRFIYPFIEELSKKYPHVTTYKIDIDKEGLGSSLSNLQIFSVPTFHFFQNGEKAAEIVGADATQLKNTMEKLYK